MAKNKGEWSESYVLMQLLTEGRVPVAYLSDALNNEGVRPLIPSPSSLTIHQLRLERSSLITYTFIRDPRGIVTEIQIDCGNAVVTIPASEVERDAATFRVAFGNAVSKNKGTFNIGQAENILSKYCLGNGKTKSTLKQDIEISVLDACGIPSPLKGYSIKSYIGGGPTLFNASAQAVFRYRINGMKTQDALAIAQQFTPPKTQENKKANKAKGWVVKLMQDLDKAGVFTGTVSVPGTKFSRNLSLLDSQMGEILGHMLFLSYITADKKISSSLEWLILSDPLELGTDARVFYTYRIKHFLRAAALGFTSARPWNGNEGAEGGMLILDKMFNICCFNSAKSEFEDYLLHSSYFDTPSSDADKNGGFAEIKKDTETNSYYIELMLQVREKNPFNK